MSLLVQQFGGKGERGDEKGGKTKEIHERDISERQQSIIMKRDREELSGLQVKQKKGTNRART